DAAPLVRVTPLIRFQKAAEQGATREILLNRALAWAKDYYALSSDLKPPEPTDCKKVTFYPVTFHVNGLTGTVVATDDCIVAMVIPEPDDQLHTDLTAAIMKALFDAYTSPPCG